MLCERLLDLPDRRYYQISLSDETGKVLCIFKMLGLYLYTLIIGHKSCNRLSILNKLTFQEKLQNVRTNNVFRQKSKNTTTSTKQKIKPKTLAETGNRTRVLSHKRGCVTFAPQSQLRVTMYATVTNKTDIVRFQRFAHHRRI